MQKMVLLGLVLLSGLQFAHAETSTDMVLQQKQKVELNCGEFGKVTVAEYALGDDFSVMRLVDAQQKTFYLPFTGGNTAYHYEDQMAGLDLSTDHGDLSKESNLTKKEISGEGKESIKEYKCSPVKK